MYVCSTFYYHCVEYPILLLLACSTLSPLALYRYHSHRRKAVSTSLTMHIAEIDNLGTDFSII